jgi:tRNA1(Val) A37 N6-methylase TrmN6
MNKAQTIHLLNKRLELQQVENGFRSSIDAVLLAAACPAQSGQTLLDMGCGVGSAGLCVLTRVPGVRLTGIDIQADHAEISNRNAALNKTDAQFLCADVRDFILREGAKNILFDNIICNPPYNDAGAHHRSPSEAKALAMGHDETTLQDWVNCANRNLKSGGSFTLVHKADQVDKILLAFDGRFGAVEIFPLWPHEGEAAKRVIVRAVKDRKTPAILHAGLVLHDQNGEYTPQTEDILRHVKALL